MRHLVLLFVRVPLLRLVVVWLALVVVGSALSAFGPDVTDAQATPAFCAAPIEPVTLANPTVVTTCTQDGLQAALQAGGEIRFACGSEPTTIMLSSPLVTSATKDIVLDGGGVVTLDGGGTTRILEKPFTPGSENDKTLGNDLTIQNMRFVNGRAPAATKPQDGNARGGAIWVTSPGTRVHIINSVFENNRTRSTTDEDNQGGAVYAANIYETVIVGSTFTGNEAGNGGAFGGIATGLRVYNSHFADNHATDDMAGGIVRGHGGALHLDGVTNNFNPDSNKVVDVCGSTFVDNTAVRGGGAIKVTVSDNKGTKATYQRSVFRNNRLVGVPSAEGHGGAIYHIEDDFDNGTNEENIVISESLFNNNYAFSQGGAVWLLVRGKGEIVNSTFTENAAAEADSNRVGQGGALMISKGNIDITSSTFANNFATFQGGAIHAGGDSDPERVVRVGNSIFVNNRLDPTHTNPVTSEYQGYHTNRPLESSGPNIQFPRTKTPDFDNDVNNLISTDQAAIIFADPLLAALADNGGPTPTLALLANSPAINAADDVSCPPVDQRGIDRPQGGGCDLGAFERVVQLAVNPRLIAVTQSDRTITVTGGGFTEASIVRWGSTALPTTYVDSTTLQATIAGSLLKQPGKVEVTVSNVDLPAATVSVVDDLQQLFLPVTVQ